MRRILQYCRWFFLVFVVIIFELVIVCGRIVSEWLFIHDIVEPPWYYKVLVSTGIPFISMYETLTLPLIPIHIILPSSTTFIIDMVYALVFSYIFVKCLEKLKIRYTGRKLLKVLLTPYIIVVIIVYTIHIIGAMTELSLSSLIIALSTATRTSIELLTLLPYYTILLYIINTLRKNKQ